MIEITYRALNLHSAPYNITQYDGYDMPDIDIKSIELAREDGAIQTTSRITAHTITVSGQIMTSTKAALVSAIDLLKAYLYQPNGQLVVTDDDDITRTFDATPQNVSITRTRGGATQARYSIQFYCPKPYSVSQNVKLLDTNITAQPTNMAISIQGTYPGEPLITLTINSITAGIQTITIGNDAINRTIGITDTFAGGDVIRIDNARKEVYLNTIKHDYTGAFAKWGVGGGSINYVDTADARDVDIVITADVRML